MKSLFGSLLLLICTLSIVSCQTWDVYYYRNSNCSGDYTSASTVVAHKTCFTIFSLVPDIFHVRYVDSVGDFVLASGCPSSPLTNYIHPFNNTCFGDENNQVSQKLIMRNCNANIKAIPRQQAGGSWYNNGRFYQIYDVDVKNYSPSSCAINNATVTMLVTPGTVESSWNIQNFHLSLSIPVNATFYTGIINLFGDLPAGQSNTAAGLIASFPADRVPNTFVLPVSAIFECNDSNAPQCIDNNTDL